MAYGENFRAPWDDREGNLFDWTAGNVLGVVGLEGADLPLIGGLFSNPEDEKLAQQYEQLQQAYQQYRPLAAQGRMQGLAQILGAFGPVQNALTDAYGQGAEFDLSGLLRNPMPSMMTQVGAPPPPKKDGGGGGDIFSALTPWFV